ncbi:MAG: Trk family potassium uptake protein [Firmicutes bacterium]|nr:Trk family potassium uptake protein [Candidatus Fermentithermobacillaceae bacterium]
MSDKPFPRRLTPVRLLVMGFALVILVGAGILTLPVSSARGTFTSPVDALFTATSAVCVTGLTVVNTAFHWSTFGKAVVLLLIQVGGLGIMTIATGHALVTGRRVGLWERMAIQEQTGFWTLQGLVLLVKRIILATALFESLGALILAVVFHFSGGLPVGESLWFGLFHSVSAFCNAGFDITGRSLVDFVDNTTLVLTVTSLIIAGGLGFHVLVDLYQSRGRFRELKLHSKIVIKTTFWLLLAGTVLSLLLEHGNPGTMGNLDAKGKILASWFLSVTPRTAGFNTVPTEALRTATAFVVILLMFVGASPGGTGGGIKTSTFAILVRSVIGFVRREADVTFGGRRVPESAVMKAIVIFAVALGLVVTSTLVLCITEEAEFLDILFEVVSAFGTVGLSRGITPNLTVVGKLTLILTMFAGRVGPLTLAMALSKPRQCADIKYPEEKVSVG